MSPPESFRAVRWIRTFNLILQAVLFTTFFGGLNYLALHYNWRFDLTAHRRHSLSPETLSYLNNLRQPVRIVVTLTERSAEEDPLLAQTHRDIGGLLREYVYATETNDKGRITTEFLDVFQRRREAEQLGIEHPNTILVLCGERRRVIGLDELYRMENGRRLAFQGEQAFTAAILDVSSPGRKKIYFLVGHGEMRPDDVDPLYGLSAVRDELRLRNFDIDLLELPRTRAIPEDATLLVAAGPQGRFEPFEEELLRQWLATRAGRLVIMLAPGVLHGLDNLFYDWGVLVDDNWIHDDDPDSVAESGDLRLKTFLAHPITQTVFNRQIPLVVGPSRSVRQDPGRTLDESLKVAPLVATAPSAWGERSYRQGIFEYHPDVDLRGLPQVEPLNRLSIMVASERVVPPKDELPFSIRGGRLVVIGTADLISNNRIGTPGNQNLFLGAVNWTIDRDTQLNVPARPIEQLQLALSQQELFRLRYSLLLALPAAAAVLGLIVYWTRRS